MKKIYAINCSPRKNWNTAKVLESALKGAADAGAETKLIHLVDLKFSGCTSCFACKRKGASTGMCAFNDALTAVLEEVCGGDGLIIGTPVYFGGETGMCRNLIERLFFPALSYDDFSISMAKKRFPIAFVYTMNVPEEMSKNMGYTERFRLLPETAARLFGDGKPESLFVCDTVQFSDYSKFHAGRFDAEHKAKVRETQFPQDCDKAYRLGASFVNK
ncbi:MAG: flavodoxin family protein [Oligosphaeraceae bacterium]|nr:flavodoxin family protein [Oligosphaeraceae bacterium]